MASPWTPPPFDLAQARMAEHDAWYSGDPERLADTYQAAPRTRPSQLRGGLVGAVSRFFWGRPANLTQRPTRLHVPLAADIATASADLLFAEPPRISIDDETTQTRLDEILHSPTVHSGLLEAAELASALGGTYLRIAWDHDLETHPMLDTVHADAAIPEWRWGRLAAVTFWSVLEDNGQQVIRWLEHHEPGRILHTLHDGTPGDLGRAMPLTEHPATSSVAELVDADSAITTGTQRLTAAYVPNIRPNRQSRSVRELAPLGRSDLDGIEPLLDAIDEAYSSWMRDVRLAKGRLIVPRGYLDNLGPGQGAAFDDERELFTEINAMSRGTDGPEITLSQFAIRVTEHRDTVDQLVRAALRSAGLSPATMGDQQDGTAVTATEIAARERISERTRAKKILHWSAGLSAITSALLDVDRAMFGGPGSPDAAPLVEFPDRSQPDPEALARTAELLLRAEAASTDVRVRMVHPDWADEQVAAEVTHIRAEHGATEPDPAEILRQRAGDPSPENLL